MLNTKPPTAQIITALTQISFPEKTSNSAFTSEVSTIKLVCNNTENHFVSSVVLESD